MTERLPRITIIVPSKNGQSTVGKCLESILALDYPDFSVIMVNDGSTDDTQKILEGFSARDSRVTVLSTGGVGPSAARNRAIAVADGEYLAFTDDDCVVHPSWLRELLRGFPDAGDGRPVGGVGGSQLSPADENDFGRSVNDFLKTIGFVADYIKSDGDGALRDTAHNPSCNVLYRREVIAQCGGFDEGLWPGEDVELDRRISRAGYRHRYNSAALVYHYRPATMAGFYRMMFSYGRVQALLVRRFGFFRTIHFEPPVLIGCLVLAGFKPWLLPVLAALTVLFLVAKTGSFFRAVRDAVFLAVTLSAWNAGFVRGLFVKTNNP